MASQLDLIKFFRVETTQSRTQYNTTDNRHCSTTQMHNSTARKILIENYLNLNLNFTEHLNFRIQTEESISLHFITLKDTSKSIENFKFELKFVEHLNFQI